MLACGKFTPPTNNAVVNKPHFTSHSSYKNAIICAKLIHFTLVVVVIYFCVRGIDDLVAQLMFHNEQVINLCAVAYCLFFIHPFNTILGTHTGRRH